MLIEIYSKKKKKKYCALIGRNWGFSVYIFYFEIKRRYAFFLGQAISNLNLNKTEQHTDTQVGSGTKSNKFKFNERKTKLLKMCKAYKK